MEIKTKYEIGQRVWIVYRNRGEVCVCDDYIIEICVGKDRLCYMLEDYCDDVAEENIILYDETDKLVEKIKQIAEEIKNEEEE